MLFNPCLEKCLIQFSVSYHEGAKAFAGKILDDKDGAKSELGKAEIRNWQTDSIGPLGLGAAFPAWYCGASLVLSNVPRKPLEGCMIGS